MRAVPGTHPDLPQSNTALLIVDVQNDFCHEKGSFSTHRKVDLSYTRKAIFALLPFIREVRRLEIPLVFIQTIHSAWTSSSSWMKRLSGEAGEMNICAPGSWGSRFYQIKPEENDCIVIKHRYSAFFQTNLDLVLRSRHIEKLLVAGVLTNVCVESTIRDAFSRNYETVLLEDCCASYDPAEHEAAVRNIGKYFGKVSDSAETLCKLKKRECGNASNRNV